MPQQNHEVATSEPIILRVPGIADITNQLGRIEKALESRAATPPAVEPLVVNREGAAEMLGCSVSSIDTWRRSGDLTATFLDNRPRFLVADLREFAESRREK